MVPNTDFQHKIIHKIELFVMSGYTALKPMFAGFTGHNARAGTRFQQGRKLVLAPRLSMNQVSC
jgi:hypothetical protein